MTDLEIGNVLNTAELTRDYMDAMQESGYPVMYGWLLVAVTYDLVDKVVAELEGKTSAERKHFLKQVKQSLDTFFKKYPTPTVNSEQTPTEIQDFKNACDDVGIWFAEQVRTGKHLDIEKTFDDFEADRNKKLN